VSKKKFDSSSPSLSPKHIACYSSKRVRTHGQEHPYGAHLFTPSLFFKNPDMCVEKCVRIYLCPFCAYTTFIHQGPDV